MFAKRGLEAALVHGGPGLLARRLHRGRTLIIAYHNIVPSPDAAGADRSLHLPRERFAAQLELLRHTHDIVPLADALATPSRAVRPRAAITFDDAYAGAVRFGLEVLASLRLPATLFVAPGRLGGQSFWWDTVAGSEPGPSPEFRSHALDVLAGRDAESRAAAARFGLREVDVPAWSRSATEADVDEALRLHPGLTLGAHSWSHPNLAALSGAELQEQLVRPLEWLHPRGDRVLPWLAYPYGLRSPEVERAARDAGYQAGLLVDGGWLGDHPANPFSLPRLNVPAGVSDDGFALRAAGLLR